MQDHPTKNRPKIAAIVPAFNEEKTIGDVVGVLKRSPYLDEVIVVSDGSQDKTTEVSRAAGATTIHEFETSAGKGTAMVHGMRHTDAPIIVFFDADLKGLTTDHIEQLVLPVLSGSRDMNVGLRDKGPILTPIAKRLPLIGGERALKRDIIENIKPNYLRGFMVETALNYYCRIHKRPYGLVELRGLDIRRKYEKIGWPKAIIAYVDMAFQIVKANVIVRLARLLGKF
ncbi:glycosyltransferase family 2 protein [Patescibacteria group bacterium]|nr:glycosyltransferase family 2 protein [Patescibacteria group bacterium]